MTIAPGVSMFENTEWLPGRDSHMLPFGEQRGDKYFVFSPQMFRQPCLMHHKSLPRKTRRTRKGTNSAVCFSHILRICNTKCVLRRCGCHRTCASAGK